jgi:hypothetical protein
MDVHRASTLGITSARDQQITAIPHYARNIRKFHGGIGTLSITPHILANDGERSAKGQ